MGRTENFVDRRDAILRTFSERRRQVNAGVEGIMGQLSHQGVVFRSRIRGTMTIDLDLERTPTQYFSPLTHAYLYQAQSNRPVSVGNPLTMKDILKYPPCMEIDRVWRKSGEGHPEDIIKSQIRIRVLDELNLDTSRFDFESTFIHKIDGNTFTYCKVGNPNYSASTFMVWQQDPDGLTTETIVYATDIKLLDEKLRTEKDPLGLNFKV